MLQEFCLCIIKGSFFKIHRLIVSDQSAAEMFFSKDFCMLVSLFPDYIYIKIYINSAIRSNCHKTCFHFRQNNSNVFLNKELDIFSSMVNNDNININRYLSLLFSSEHQFLSVTSCNQ